ncbi:MAG: hypothetical protein CFE43_15045 [Burkholderiales bacterium PBB3]|nr:MAG: hypothetical protein CFE43_15045 [Burkholderiales bacterium PBB3]
MALHFKLTPVACATALAFLLLAPAKAQQNPGSLADVTVTGKAAPVLDVQSADVGGLGLSWFKTPQSVSVLGADILLATGASTLSQAIKLDASLADSYNTTGYVENMSVRGFLLDPSSNYRRNGLAISSYTPLALENKERIEILKGVAGMQSGVSSPGGLVNFVTKVPVPDAFSTVQLSTNNNGGAKVHLDSNGAWGTVGVRFNLASESLQSYFNQASGSREFASLALNQSLTRDTSVSADIEYHHKRQPSVPGLGLLDTNGDGVGDTLPDRINPRLNLNDQSWSLPFETTNAALQLGLKTRLSPDWSAQASFAVQRAVINDRIAFPDGCSNAANYVYPGLCANGDVDIYDFRSDGEERTSWGWDARATRALSWLGLGHQVTVGISGRGNRDDLPPLQAYNYVGSTNIYTPMRLPADANLTELNTNTRQRAVDSFVTLVSDVSTTVQTVIGLRTSSLSRSSARSDGSRAVTIDQTISTPWLAATWQTSPSSTVYASWGQGVELEVVPNRSSKFVNYGETLPALKSEQVEMGWKWLIESRFTFSAAVFSIDKPYADDQPSVMGLPTRVTGGKSARHRGLELALQGRVNSQLSVQSTLSMLDARYATAIDPTLVGQRITNVPKLKVSVFADYKLAELPGLSVHGLLGYEDGKTASADGTATLPSAMQIDVGLGYAHRIQGRAVRWQLGIDNLTDRIYWREAPTQSWGGVYLFPSTPRTVRASVSLDF